MMFPFLTVFIIFLLITAARREMLSRRRREREQAFWAREEEAAHTPAKNLSEIEYIKVPLSDFPIGKIDDDDLMIMEEELRDIAKRRLLNLNGLTNTDVKIAYGTSNFDTVSRMGEDFDRLIMLLCDYAKGLIEGGHEAEAITVLEFGAEIGSDISANYTLLGECYGKLGRADELERLQNRIGESALPLKQSILEELEAIPVQELEEMGEDAGRGTDDGKHE